MKQKLSMTDEVHKNGATVKNVKRCQPVKNACAVMKFRQLRLFQLKFKARLSLITAILEIFAVEFNCVGNDFLKVFFSGISWKSFLSFDVFKMAPFAHFAVILVFNVIRYF